MDRSRAAMGVRRAPGPIAYAAGLLLLLAAASPPTVLSQYSEHDTEACEAAKTVGDAKCNPHYAQPECKTLSDTLGYALQFVLAIVGFMSLLLKKHLEERRTGERRTYLVWGLDVSKQAASGVCAHAAAIINSGILNRHNEVMSSHGRILSTDECSWYFTSFTLDTTLGVFLSYLMFQLQAKLARQYSDTFIGALGRSGEYMDLEPSGGQPRVNYGRWGAQLFVWCLITVAARMMVLGVQLLLFDWLRYFVGMIAQTMACRPGAMLTLVMVACPVLMNIGMLWVQDHFLKKQPALASDTQEAGAHGQAPPKKKRNIRKCVCDCILISVVVIGIGGTMLFYMVYVGAEQGNYDHCYTHVRKFVDDPKPGTPVAELDNSRKPIEHKFDDTHAACMVEDGAHSLKDYLEHRGDMMDDPKSHSKDDPLTVKANPQCQCCNVRTRSGDPGNDTCTKLTASDGPFQCSGIGECCGRSLLHSMDKELVESCSVCPIYLPCDQAYCPARPDFIRNAQHVPMLMGVLLSLVGNGYVIYTYSFDPKLRKANITTLLFSASIIEVIKSASLVFQEMLFRIPRSPCFPEKDINGNGYLDAGDCTAAPQWYDWPTWQSVEFGAAHTEASVEVMYYGQRGNAVAMCQPMSFIYQFTWTAYDSYFWMITVDLFLNLYTSPFGSTKRRWQFYHGWTMVAALVLSIWLVAAGDWGVSYKSILEDFCWNVNWGQQGKIFGGVNATQSNSDYLMPTVYILSAFYYVTSVIGAFVAKGKLRNLTQGLRKARENTIAEGGKVVFFFSLWQLGFCLIYFWVLTNTPRIVNNVDWTQGPRQYSQDDEIIVWIWAFVLGARNFINFLVWKVIVIPRHNKEHQNEFLKFAGDAFSALPLTNSDPRQDAADAPVQELNDVLMRELLWFTGLGIRSAVRYPYAEHAPAPGTRSGKGRLERLLTESGADADAREVEVRLKEAGDHEESNSTAFAANMNHLFAGDAAPPERQSQAEAEKAELERHKEEQERREHLTQFKFKTYQPRKFRELRELFQVRSGNPPLQLVCTQCCFHRDTQTKTKSGNF
jgi:hypothetical protein